MFFFVCLFVWIISFLTYSWCRMKCQNVHAGPLGVHLACCGKRDIQTTDEKRLRRGRQAPVRAVSDTLLRWRCPWGKQLTQGTSMWLLDIKHTQKLVLSHSVHDSQEAAEQAVVFIYLLRQPAFCWNQQRKVGVKTFPKLTAESSEGCTDLLRRDFFKGNSEVVTSSVDSELQQINLSWLTRLVLQVPVPLVEAAPSRWGLNELLTPQVPHCPSQCSTEKQTRTHFSLS